MKAPHFLAALLIVSGMTAAAAADPTVRVTPRRDGSTRIDVVLDDAPLSRALSALSMRLGRPVTLSAPDRILDLELRGLEPEAALKRIAAIAGFEAIEGSAGWVVRDPNEPTVTLDATDEEIRSILRSVQRQCGIRNLMVDPEVKGKGTFLFAEVPCSLALRTILSSLGLSHETYPSVVRVKGS